MTAILRAFGKHWKAIASVIAFGILAVAMVVLWPQLQDFASRATASLGGRQGEKAAKGETGHDAEAAHDQGAAAAGEDLKLELTDQARRSIGLETGPVKLGTFEKTMTVPAVVVARPGITELEMTAPLSGIVTRIHCIEGESLEPGAPLFEVRLTHEELVKTQADFLHDAEHKGLVRQDVERLERAAESGALAGKTLIERQHQLHLIEAKYRANREALLMHGLDEQQIESIEETGKLLKGLTIRAPEVSQGELLSRTDGTELQPWLEVGELAVRQGQHVAVGQTLAVLRDLDELYIEGKAFEHDSERLHEAASKGWTLTGVFEAREEKFVRVPGLRIDYVANQVDPETRALRFYVDLPNEVARDATTEGHRFVSWRYKPGQRVRLEIPVDYWEDQIVLPVEAVATEGLESYVFVQNGKHFQRKPVTELYRDQSHVVVAYEADSIRVGQYVALKGAHRLHQALKNQTGMGDDPHAGHHHN